MSKEILKQFELDLSKTISIDKYKKCYIAFYKKSFYKYYHSKYETENYFGNLIIYDELVNDIITSYSFAISENDWNFYKENGISNLKMLYDINNDVILVILDNLEKTKKIIKIIYYQNLIRKDSEEKIESEARLCNENFESKTLQIKDSSIGKINLEFISQKTNLKNSFVIYNVSDDDYTDAISGSPFDEIVIDEEKYYKLGENEEADKEISRFTINSDNYYLPFKFFTEEEWNLITKRFPTKFFRTSLNDVFNRIAMKYDYSKQPNQVVKDSIIKEIEDNFIEDKEVYTESNDRYNANDWLKDASGTSDPDVMNDVYWNLD